MQPEILLINGIGNSPWRRAIEEFGKIQIATRNDATKLIQVNHYALTILDVAIDGDITSFILQIRRIQPIINVIVVAASPDWRQSRDVLQAGARYLPKSTPLQQLRTLLEETLH